MSMNLSKKTLADVDVKGKRVLMRVDFNVPQDDSGAITNNQRIVGAIPTIQKALDGGAKAVILMSHLGRPDGNPKPNLTLKPIADRLGELMGKPVTFLKDCVGAETEAACADPAPGSIIVLENLRWHVEEEGKGINHEQGGPCKDGAKPKKCTENCQKFKATEEATTAFRESLSKLGDVYVCDAFGTAHRAHSSLVGMKGKMPCVAGDLVNKELDAFKQVIGDNVQRPLTAIVGGAKISDKVLVIENLIAKSDAIIICGGMAYTFLKECKGMAIGKSLYDKNGAALAPKLVKMAEERARRAEKMLTIERRLMAIEREYDEIVHLLEQQREQQQRKGWLRVAWPMRYLSHLVGRREPTKSADGGQPSDSGQQADSHSGKRSARKGSLQSGQL